MMPFSIILTKIENDPNLKKYLRSETSSFTESNSRINTNYAGHKTNKMENIKVNKQYKCDKCKECFMFSYLLEKHSLLHIQGITFECIDCNKSFKSGIGLKSHQQIYHHLHLPQRSFRMFTNIPQIDRRTMTFKCDECCETFRTRYLLLQHTKGHMEEKLFPCVECDKKFESRYLLLQHSRRHSDEEDLACKECDCSFKTEDLLIEHSKQHSDESIFPCIYCFKVFKNKNLFEKHRRLHINGKTYIAPNMCNKRLLVQHRKVHIKEKGFVCRHCKRCFSTKYFLQKHEKSHALRRIFPCKQCKKKFGTEAECKRHETMHFVGLPYKCIVCGERFRNSIDLNHHLLIHKREKDFRCLQCERMFKTNLLLQEHSLLHTRKASLKSQQPLTKVQTLKSRQLLYETSKQYVSQIHMLRGDAHGTHFECPQCQKTFKTRSIFEKHSMRHVKQMHAKTEECAKRTSATSQQHLKGIRSACQQDAKGQISKTEFADGMKCKMCNKCFQCKPSLQQHTRRHINERPFTCKHCNKYFKTRTVLYKHFKRHMEKKPFICIQCKKVFRLKNNLKQHYILHIISKPYKCLQCKKSFRCVSSLKYHSKMHMKGK